MEGERERERERGAGVGSLLVIFQASSAPLFGLDGKCEGSEMLRCHLGGVSVGGIPGGKK